MPKSCMFLSPCGQVLVGTMRVPRQTQSAGPREARGAGVHSLSTQLSLPFPLCRSVPACAAVSTPDPGPPERPPSRAPRLAPTPQILPSYPAVSQARRPPVPKAFLSSPVKHLPRPPAPAALQFPGHFPRLPAPIPSAPPDRVPHPPRSSSVVPDPGSQGRLFHKTYRPEGFLPAQRCSPAALVRRSLPARLAGSPAPGEAWPGRSSSCSSRPPPRLAAWPDRPAGLDPLGPEQPSRGPPQAFLHQPPPPSSPSARLPSSPSSLSPSSSSPVSASSLPSPPRSRSPSPCLPAAYLGFPSPVPAGSPPFLLEPSSFPRLLPSPCLGTSPAPFIPALDPPLRGERSRAERSSGWRREERTEKQELRGQR